MLCGFSAANFDWNEKERFEDTLIAADWRGKDATFIWVDHVAFSGFQGLTCDFLGGKREKKCSGANVVIDQRVSSGFRRALRVAMDWERRLSHEAYGGNLG